MITLRPMEWEEVEEIYHREMEQDFPGGELKPLKSIEGMLARGVYQCLSVDWDGTPAGYAFLVLPREEHIGLIDYLAIFPENRNRGLGGQVLATLRDYSPERMLVLETEYPAEAPDPAMAARRLGFYLRNGGRVIPMGSRVFGVRYLNLALALPERDLTDLASEIAQLYCSMVTHAAMREKYLKFWRTDTPLE